MTMTTASATLNSPTSLIAVVMVKLGQAYRVYRSNRQARKAIRDLRQLNGHTLKDIGLHRSEITSVVRADQTERRRGYAGS